MEYKIAISTAGHDLNEVYVAFRMSQGEVHLANGRNKTINAPKRKNPKHIKFVENGDEKLAELLVNCCTDEAIHQTVLYYKKKLLLTKI